MRLTRQITTLAAEAIALRTSDATSASSMRSCASRSTADESAHVAPRFRGDVPQPRCRQSAREAAGVVVRNAITRLMIRPSGSLSMRRQALPGEGAGHFAQSSCQPGPLVLKQRQVC